MNERIKELERQATETVKCGLNGTSTTESFNRKKFAELIVRECARIVINNGIATAIHDQMLRQDCVNDIKRHFGVES